MAIITNADIEQRLGSDTYVQLTDDDGDGVADVGLVDEARLGAEGELESYLAQRYQVPIDTGAQPALVGVLTSIALDLVEYRLRSRRPPVPKDAVDRHARVLEWLTGLADGSTSLPSATDLPGAATAQVIGEKRVLTRSELSDF